VQWYRFNMFWRYGDGLLPFLRKDPDWPHPIAPSTKGNDRHREELTKLHPFRTEGSPRPDRKMRADLSALRQAHPGSTNGWFRTLIRRMSNW